jgi:hypothetical protein
MRKEQGRAVGPALIPLRALARRSGRFPPLPCPPPRLLKCSTRLRRRRTLSTFVTVSIRRLPASESLRLLASSMCPLDLVLVARRNSDYGAAWSPRDDRIDFIGVGRTMPERGHKATVRGRPRRDG